MTTLNIGGRKVTVGDSFKSLSPEQQNATVDEIARSLRQAAPATNQPPGVPEYVPPGVEGYDPQTGEVTKPTGGASDRIGAFLSGSMEGMPVVGPSFSNVMTDAAAVLVAPFSDQSFGDVRQGMVDRRKQVEAENPLTALAGNVTGGILGTAPLVAAAPAAFGAGGGSLAARAGAAGLSGSALGGADSAVRSGGDMGETAMGAGVGGTLGLAGPAIGRVAGKTVAMFSRKNPTVMNMDEIKATKNLAYQTADQLGVRYKPDAFNSMIRDLTNDMQSMNLSPMRHPKAASMVTDMQALKDSAPTLTQMDQLRQVVARDVAGSTDPAERHFGQAIIERIDNFLDNADAVSVSAGDPALGAATIKEARKLNTRMRKLEKIQNVDYAADLSASSSGSGGNVDNATRQRVKSLLLNEKKMRGFTPDERALMETIVRGSRGQNALRLAGKFSPTSGGLSAMLGVGATAANPAMAIPAAAGYVAKTAADKITGRNFAKLADLVSVGGDKSALAKPSTAFQRFLESPEGKKLVQSMALGATGSVTQGANSLIGFPGRP